MRNLDLEMQWSRCSSIIARNHNIRLAIAAKSHTCRDDIIQVAASFERIIRLSIPALADLVLSAHVAERGLIMWSMDPDLIRGLL